MNVKPNFNTSDLNDYLFHARREEREDHKYVKREWKKGKWVYTYPSDAKDPDNSKKTSTSEGSRRAQREADRAASGRKMSDAALAASRERRAAKEAEAKKEAERRAQREKEREQSGRKMSQEALDASRNRRDATQTVENGDGATESTTKNTSDSVKSAFGKMVDNLLSKASSAASGVNKLVDIGKKIIDDFLDNKDNMYDVSSYNYDEKIEEIKKTKEWQDIVARQDPEYVRRNDDGSLTYLIDDYLVDKKHPLLDAIGDVIAGREIDYHEITRETTIAGLKDYAMGTLRSGILVATVGSKFLTEKFKFQQGSYDDDLQKLIETAENGKEYVNNFVDTVSETTKKVKETADDTKANVTSAGVSQESVSELMRMIRNGAEKTNATDAAKAINDGNVVKAAKLIMQSDMLRDTLGNNEYYKLVESTLSGLTEQEAEALNLLIRTLRGQ